MENFFPNRFSMNKEIKFSIQNNKNDENIHEAKFSVQLKIPPTTTTTKKGILKVFCQ